MTIHAFSWPALLGVGALVLMTLVFLFTRERGSHPLRLMQQRMDEDATHPLKRWVQSVFMIVTRDCDYAYIPAREARRMLDDWWDIRHASEFQSALGRLRAPGRADSAWDLVRFIIVARLGVAAGYWRDPEAWRQIRPIARRLQRCYPGWAAMAQAYVHARRAWRDLPPDGSQDDPMMQWIVENISRLRHERWAQQDFNDDIDEDPL